MNVKDDDGGSVTLLTQTKAALLPQRTGGDKGIFAFDFKQSHKVLAHHRVCVCVCVCGRAAEPVV